MSDKVIKTIKISLNFLYTPMRKALSAEKMNGMVQNIIIPTIFEPPHNAPSKHMAKKDIKATISIDFD